MPGYTDTKRLSLRAKISDQVDASRSTLEKAREAHARANPGLVGELAAQLKHCIGPAFHARAFRS
ncbi:MAG: hypothetical protein LBI88_04935 [Deltaproteobacteria bacterium]|jgi:hypothetical protein|nr:hypothetical protein [Deltaproteobacteria bacterium]